ncbi:glycoside hydrolase family 99-like domain-containing protein [Burkholderia sp. TSV86]|uniref:glycoside hydrolase family 99-like domain-containing protein n=1 Tax=Burkholderia sp. TSV86 TaxID=1385594 RepID=UPI0007529A27|nr:glycoside hydrolase family 99-like domain-containing protein [Burkholderia sp. TSV86]KVE35394.1 glycosyl transferase family 1 [Burkholderia sp. TSV86]
MSEHNDDLAWDGERYIPGMSAQIEVEHMHRYLVARKLAAGRRVLDIACGEGYGSFALSQTAASVVGVDISEETVRHAAATYGHRAGNLEFIVGSAADIPLGDASVDLVVSFETIEHHDQHEAMIREIKRVLRPGGLLIISSPNKHEYSDVTGYANPWHVKELYLDEFESLLRTRFSQVALYGQRVVTGSMLAGLEPQETAVRTLTHEGPDKDSEHVGVARPLYFIALAADVALPMLDATMYEAVAGASESAESARIECKIYWQTDADDKWSERHAMGCYVLADDTERVARLELREPSAELKVRRLRFDPSDRPGVVELHAVDLLDAGGRTVWSWHDDANAALEIFGAHRLGSGWPITLVVPGGNPWFEIPVPEHVLSRISNNWALSVRFVVRSEVEAIAGLAMASQAELGMLKARIGEAMQLLGARKELHDRAEPSAADTDIDHMLRRLSELTDLFAVTERSLRMRFGKALDEKNAQLEEMNAQLADKSERLLALERERERIVNEHIRVIAELGRRNVHIRDEARLRELDVQIGEILSSTSWRLTKPLRFAKRITQGGEARSAAVRSAGKLLYRRLPMPAPFKRKIKGAFFRLLPGLFSHTRAYQDWAALRSRLREEAANRASAAQAARAPEPAVPAAPATQTKTSAPSEFPVTAVTPSSDYQAHPPSAPRQVPVRAIAYYLPQFHPFPENDEWWGRGFAEWTNVTRAVPQFVGHYQPHLPGELGFYDLRIPAVQQRQVELAKAAGLGGFCFYFYWFGGKRLMEAPIRQYLDHREFDLPFCLCWANENWSRRWDGLDQELLISQHHSPEDDMAFIEHIAQYMRDDRYIRINGRPLLLVYRPNLLPDARATVKRWRDWARANGLGELYLAYTQSFEKADPCEYGFDAAIEFPPNNSQPPSKADSVTLINPEYSGYIMDWTHFVERSRAYPDTEYRLLRGVTPSWDNEARKPGRGAVFVGSTPKLYEEWLFNAATDTVQRIDNPDERLVFINAWNEWAEGAHLEPDRRYGYAWLQATRNALTQANRSAATRRVLVVSHDAYAHGAQYLALNLVKTLTTDFGIEVTTVLLGEGPLKPEFERWGSVHDLSGVDPEGDQARGLADKLAQQGFRFAICNTTVSGLFVGTLSRSGVNCIALIHELQGMLSKYKLERHAAEIAEHAQAVVFPAEMVHQSFGRFTRLNDRNVRVRPQGLYKRNRLRHDIERARSMLRERLRLPGDAKIMLGVGYADLRKGVDLFAQAAAAFADRNDVYFVWVGHWDSDAKAKVDALIAKHGLTDKFVVTGLESDTDFYYAGADVLVLTSREDPFPSVVLEALEVGVPVVGFEGASGSCDLLKQGCGVVVPFEDVDALARALRELIERPEQARELGAKGAAIVTEAFSFRSYVFDLLDMLGCGFKRVSVVVPNYNYERYIGERLNSVFEQTYPVYELIVLDDNSSDGSVRAIREQLANRSVDNRLIANSVNSGSVFAQWKRGVELARGDYVWIAEADDLAQPAFLETVMAGFQDERTVLSYCESKQMTESGEVVCEHYRDYVADISSVKWNESYHGAGADEIAGALAVKNTIPNVSAVVFKRSTLDEVLQRHFDEIRQFRVAGDWMVYLRVVSQGMIAFSSSALNLHRRHGSSVTIGGNAEALLKEIRSIQLWVRQHHAIDASVAELADRYMQQLCEQFNVDARVRDELVH